MTRSQDEFQEVQQSIKAALNHCQIALETWKQEIVAEESEKFVLGLIHSGGCRVVTNDGRVMGIRRATARLDEIIGPKDRAVPLTNVHYTA